MKTMTTQYERNSSVEGTKGLGRLPSLKVPSVPITFYERGSPYKTRGTTKRRGCSRRIIRRLARTSIDESELPPGNNDQPRRRIALAVCSFTLGCNNNIGILSSQNPQCSRCRRRKIKCSGDPGDGSGCRACRTSTTDAEECCFMRVRLRFPYTYQ